MGVELDVRRRSIEEHEASAQKRERQSAPRVVQPLIKRLPHETVAIHENADIFVLAKEYRGKQPKLLPLTNNVQVAVARAVGEDVAAKARNRDTPPGLPDDLGAPGSKAKVDKIIYTTSDNHLNAGVNPVTQKLNPLEDSPPENDIQAVRVAFHHQRQAIHFSQLESGLRDRLLDASARLERVVLGDTTAHVSPEDFKLLRENTKVKLVLADLGDRFDFMKIIKEDALFAYPDGMSKKYQGPKNTPANVIAQLQISAQGHPQYFPMLAAKLLAGERIDMIIGNHDRALLNPFVWSAFKELVVAAAKQRFKASDEDIRQALTGMRLDLLKQYAGLIHDHGHRYVDKYNMLGDELKELVEPTPVHEEMPEAFGFYGVRKSYNGIMSKFPVIDHLSGPQWLKWVFFHPMSAAKLIPGFLFAAKQGGYEESPEHDMVRDMQRIHAVVENTDIVESFNQDLAPGQKPVGADYVEGLLRTLYFAGPKPFLSNFKEGTGLFSRIATYGKLLFTGKMDRREVDQIIQQGTAAAAKYAKENGGPPIFGRVAGHTHEPRRQVSLTETGQALLYINDGSGLYQITNDPSNLTFDKHDHGAGVTEIGTTNDGKAWVLPKLDKVVDSKGTNLPAHMVELDDPAMKKARKLVVPIVRNLQQQKKKNAAAAP